MSDIEGTFEMPRRGVTEIPVSRTAGSPKFFTPFSCYSKPLAQFLVIVALRRRANPQIIFLMERKRVAMGGVPYIHVTSTSRANHYSDYI
jgi:hypothetical protein